MTPQTIRFNDVGNPGWDPLCYATDDAFRYFMPGLARLAFGVGDAYYLACLLFHLETDRIERFSPSQKRAVASLLDHLATTLAQEIEANGDAETLDRVRNRLRPESVQ